MTNSSRPKRTAILAIHGMGLQRPMKTVRGVVNAVWLDADNQETPEKRYWTHTQPNGNDIDLSVIATNSATKYGRAFDFQELYWSYLMDRDGRLTFVDPHDGRRYFHSGALFGLTRWTNLYFDANQLLWGDAIGGRLAKDALNKYDLFGEGVRDVELTTDKNKRTELFSHTAYWDTTYPDGRAAPHIEKLRAALDLRDKVAKEYFP